jgi:hypothetical protein
MSRLTQLRLTTAVALTLFAAPLLPATTLARMTLEEMTSASPVVARVRCAAQEARWEQGRIWTFTTFAVVETWKGQAGDKLTVRLPGGRVGHLISKVDGAPRFVAGEEMILFLQPTASGDYGVVSWAQGTFRVRAASGAAEERVTQDTAGMTLYDPVKRTFEPGTVRNMALSEFRQRFVRAVERNREGR